MATRERCEIEESLDAIAARVQESSPFDLSPRGIRFRPDAGLAAQIESVVQTGNSAVPVIAAKLDIAVDPLMCLVWLYLLRRTGTEIAESAIAAFVARVEREEVWGNTFPP